MEQGNNPDLTQQRSERTNKFRGNAVAKWFLIDDFRDKWDEALEKDEMPSDEIMSEWNEKVSPLEALNQSDIDKLGK